MNPSTHIIHSQITVSERQELHGQALQDGSFCSLLKDSVYRRNLIIMTIIWSFGSFGFFLIPFYLGTIKGNIYLFAIFSGSAELAASLACILVTRCITLKTSIVIFCVISAVASLLIMLLFNNVSDIAMATLIMFANFGVTSTFDLAYLINTELFPTIYLATAYGCCNILGRFISILSPEIARIEHPYPMLIMVVFGGISATLGLFLVNLKKE